MLILADYLYLDEDHGGDLLGRERLLLAEILDLHLGTAVIVDHLERPGFNILLDGWVVKSPSDETPGLGQNRECSVLLFATHLTSKTVFAGFMAA